MKRPLKNWNKFLQNIGTPGLEADRNRALEDPDFKAHLDAVRRMPSAVQEAWALYCSDTDRIRYPHGFEYHFPLQWRWMELQAAAANGEERLSQKALKAAGLGPDTVRRPDGDVDRWPSGRPMGTNSPGIDPDFDDDDTYDGPGTASRGHRTQLWRDSDGSIWVIDANTGEILEEYCGQDVDGLEV